MGFYFNKNIIVVISLSFFLTACSQSKNSVADPYENFNRKVFAFNEGLDHLALKPAAQAYKLVTPDFAEKGVKNVIGNLEDVGNAVNNLLQLKFSDAGNDIERVVFNSTLGFLGWIDIASAAGLEKHDEDFGQTLAKWGVESGPYLMLPFFGPSTVRDAAGKFSVDRFTDPLHYSEDSVQHALTEAIVKRADLLSEEQALSDFSNDKYSALRDVWLQRRDSLIRDGKIDEDADSDLIDELESLEAE